MTLSNHNYGYQFSLDDLSTAMLYGVSGAPYASRHLEMAKLGTSEWSHKVIGTIEYVPVIGGAVAALERMIHPLFASSKVNWRKKPVLKERAVEKMIHNQEKAIMEHYNGYLPWIINLIFWFFNPYSKSLNLSISDLGKKKDSNLEIKHHVSDAQGPRPTMEDAHFYKVMEKGSLAGVFDGHGGSEVSAFVCQEFQKRFPGALKKADGNVHAAFEKVFEQIQRSVASHSDWNHQGSTAVVSYIDSETHQIYTATLGDSEANIYRKTGLLGGISSIPLSCVRDWLSGKDLNRLIAFHGEGAVKAWLKEVGYESKYIRSNLIYGGVNVSRAFGDLVNTGKPITPLVIHKPKITVNQLKAGDVVTLACDGLKDYASESQIVKIVSNRTKGQNSLAHQLVNEALKNMTSRGNDNVTVLALEIS